MADLPSRRDLLTFWRRRDPPKVDRSHLRPPGAIAEAQFLDQCVRCGQCIAICPADAIVALDEPGKGFGTPVVKARNQACVLCNGLQCTQTCPSGALLPLRFHHEIQMGTAFVDVETCRLSKGQACDVCVDECPVPQAIAIDDNRIVVDPAICVGCGACEQHCPSEPVSIRITPR